MADQTFTVDHRNGRIGWPSDDQRAAQGEVIRFQVEPGSGTVRFSGFRSDVWENSSTFTLSNGQHRDVRIRTNAYITEDEIMIQGISGGGGTSPVEEISITIRKGPDITPDPFTVPNLSNAAPNSLYIYEVDVTGIDTNTDATISSSNGQVWVLNRNGGTHGGRDTQALWHDKRVYVVVKASPDYDTFVNCYLVIGTRGTSFYVKTQPRIEPENETYFGGNRGSDLVAHHAGPARGTAWRRGGIAIDPHTSLHDGIPSSSNGLRGSDLKTSRRTFYYIEQPRGQFVSYNAYLLNKDNKTITDWDIDIRDHLKLAWGPSADSDIDYRYVWTSIRCSHYSSEIKSDLSTANGYSAGSFHKNNVRPRIRITRGDPYQKGVLYGILYVLARNRFGDMVSKPMNILFRFY